jgi:hypothetical protein
MLLGAIGSSICLGCVTASYWLVSEALTDPADEESIIFAVAALPFSLAAIPIGWWVPAEAWVFATTVYVVGGIMLLAQRRIERETNRN